jgi:hypothetical protein
MFYIIAYPYVTFLLVKKVSKPNFMYEWDGDPSSLHINFKSFLIATKMLQEIGKNPRKCHASGTKTTTTWRKLKITMELAS